MESNSSVHGAKATCKHMPDFDVT